MRGRPSAAGDRGDGRGERLVGWFAQRIRSSGCPCPAGESFKAGDALVFGMYTAHGSLDHHDETGRVRVSCDARWQAGALEVDARYMGDHPAGTTGNGYAELNGAKPLTEQWHVR